MRAKMMLSLCSGLLLAVGASVPAFTDELIESPIKDYLASCDKNSKGGSDCETVVDQLMTVRSGSCAPIIRYVNQKDYDDRLQLVTAAVVKWLHDHPVPQSSDANDAVATALASLYPCKH